MIASKDTITVKEWLSDSSVGQSARNTRRLVLDLYAKENGRSSAEEVIGDILAEKATVIGTSKRLIDSLRKRNLAPKTVQQYRSILPGFFESVLGEDNFRQTVFDRQIPVGDSNILTEKKIPTVDEVRTMIERASPRDKILVTLLAQTGLRESELISRRLADIEECEGGKYARIRLQSKETKAKTKRFAFITKEIFDLLRAYHRTRTDEGFPTSLYIFPGEPSTSLVQKKVHKSKREGTFQKGVIKANSPEIETPDFVPKEHLSKATAYHQIVRLFRISGLHNSEDEIYSPQSFRTFADREMTRCGLDRKYIALIIGHKSKLAAEISYKDWDDVGKQWFEKVASKVNYHLPERIEVVKEIADTESRRKLDELEKNMHQEVAKRVEEGFQQTWARVAEIERKQGISWKSEPGLPEPTELPSSNRWENHQYEYAEVSVGGPDYRAILTEGGWELFDKGENSRIFRRAKAPDLSGREPTPSKA